MKAAIGISCTMSTPRYLRWSITRCVVSAAMVPRSGPCTEGWRMV